MDKDTFALLLLSLEDPEDLISLGCSCRTFYAWVGEFGWRSWAQARNASTHGTSRNWLKDARTYAHKDYAWHRCLYRSCNISEHRSHRLPWPVNARSSIAMDERQNLVVGCGSFLARKPCDSRSDLSRLAKQSWTVNNCRRASMHDITCVQTIRGTAQVFVGFANGIIAQALPSRERSLKYYKRFDLSHYGSVQAMDNTDSILAVASRYDKLHVLRTASFPHQGADVVFGEELPSRPWTVKFLTNRQLAVGLTDDQYMTVYAEHQSNWTPVRLYDKKHRDEAIGATYALERVSTNEFASGNFDGATRVHDQRLPAYHDVVQEFRDPVDDTAVYSLSLCGHRVLAGSCRNSAVRIFDRRQASGSYTCFGHKARSSPVYSLVTQGSRIFAAVESAVSVIDFRSTYKPGPHYMHLAWTVPANFIV